MTDKPLRRVKVLREVEIDFRDLKKGDIFRMVPAGQKDVHAHPRELHISETDAEPNDSGVWGVTSHSVAVVKINNIDHINLE